MLLAKQGVSVLVVEKAAFGSDTLSTHALMRGAVTQLERWGLLDEVASGRDSGHYSDGVSLRGLTRSQSTSNRFMPLAGLFSIPIMAKAAMAAGATMKFETRVHDLVIDQPRTSRRRRD